MPRVESDMSAVTAVLPYGSPLSKTSAVRDQLIAAANQVAAENGGDSLVEGIFSVINNNEVEVDVYLTDPDVPPISTTELTALWRREVGQIPGYSRCSSHRIEAVPAPAPH
jgi:hypothetical protein